MTGSIYNTNLVQLQIAGPTGTNLVCLLENLDPTNQVWSSVATFTLTNGATTVVNSSLVGGTYGFFRTKSTNSAYYSTNAFGAIVGYAGSGQSLIGNPFGATTLTNIFPAPLDFTTVYQWVNANTNYVSSDYIGGWSSNLDIDELEGLFVQNNDTNSLRFQFSGLFSTNAISRAIPKGLSIITSYRFNLLSGSTWENDSLTNGQLGGLSGIPVQTTGFSPQCEIDNWLAASGTYNKFYLTNTTPTNLVWVLGTTTTNVPLYLGQGFFINKPTNATWSVSRPIW